MIYIRKTSILFLLTITFLLFSNADCSTKKEKTYYLSEEFKSYIIFNKGSFWIYESNSNERDTIELTNIKHSIGGNHASPPIELYNLFTSSSYHGDLSYTAVCNSHTNMIGCDEYSRYFNTSGSLSAGFYFFCCCNVGIRDEEATYLGEIEDEINGQLLYYVKMFQKDSLFPASLKTLWYAPEIGLIRYDDYQNKQWELIEFDVKR